MERVHDIKQAFVERASVAAEKLHKSIIDSGDAADKEAVRLLGANGLTQIIEDSFADMKEPTLEGQPGFLASSVQDAIRRSWSCGRGLARRR